MSPRRVPSLRSTSAGGSFVHLSRKAPGTALCGTPVRMTVATFSPDVLCGVCARVAHEEGSA